MDELSTQLSIISGKLDIENTLNDHSLNIYLERIACNLINTAMFSSFQITGKYNSRYPAIDAIDHSIKCAMQITSDVSIAKVKSTLDTLIKNNLNNEFREVIFFYLKTKKLAKLKYLNVLKTAQSNKKKFVEVNFYDLSDIQLLLQDCDLPILENLNEYLAKEIGLYSRLKSSRQQLYFSVSASFDKENERLIYSVIENILSQGVDVLISCNELYQMFSNHLSADRLHLVKNEEEISVIRKGLVILSKQFINSNNKENIDCPLFSFCLKNEVSISLYTFESNLKQYEKKFPLEIVYNVLSPKSIREKILSLIDGVRSTNNNNHNFDKALLYELIKLYSPAFEYKILENETTDTYFKIIHFYDKENINKYFLLLKEDKTFKFATDEFNKKYSDLKNVKILLYGDEHHSNGKRLNSIKRLFNQESVENIDDFLKSKYEKSIGNQKLFGITDFIEPALTDKYGDPIDFWSILNWLKERNSPIGLIIGYGGIGKTTLSEYLHDYLVSIKSQLVLFIPASEILDEIREMPFYDGAEYYDLHSIYHLWCNKRKIPNNSILEKSSFYTQLELGNLIVIFDGLDEIISAVASFNLDSFINYINGLTSAYSKSKVIINLRDIYFKRFEEAIKSKADRDLQVFNLLPFDKIRALTYFENAFPDNNRAVEKSLKIAKEMLMYEHDNSYYEYPPFLLYLISRVVINNEDEETSDYNTSDLLNLKIKNDKIIYGICIRENFKKETAGVGISVDLQTSIFCELALERKTIFNKKDIELSVKKILNSNYDSSIILKMLDHPLLINLSTDSIIGEFYAFRFNFLIDYYKSVSLYNTLNNDGYFNESHIKILAHDMGYNSLARKYLIERLKENRHNIDNIDKLYLYIILQAELNLKRAAISNLFLITLEITSDFTIKRNTELLKKYFMKSDEIIEDLSIVNLVSDKKYLFDFSGLIFKNAFIQNYAGFFDCIYNDDTFFTCECEIYGVYNLESDYGKITATARNFDDGILGDESHTSILQRIQKFKEGDLDMTIIFNSLKYFFQIIVTHAELEMKRIDIYTRYKSINKTKIEFDIIFDAIIEYSILSLNEKSKHYFVNPKCRVGCRRFIENTDVANFSGLNKTIKKIHQIVKATKVGLVQ